MEERRQAVIKEREELERAVVPDLGAADPPSSSQEAEKSDLDFSALPTQLDARLEAEDPDGAVRPTIINVSKVWSKRAQKALLGPTTTASLSVVEQKLEKNTCWDLLDALTRSGGLPIEGAQFHVVITTTHCFEKSLMDTLVKDNVNPIEKLEHSSTIMASVVHGVDAAHLKTLDE